MSKHVKVSDVVLVTVDTRNNGGDSFAPMVVTKVKNSEEEGVRLNGHVLLDNGSTTRYQNIKFLDKEPDHVELKAPEKVAFFAS